MSEATALSGWWPDLLSAAAEASEVRALWFGVVELLVGDASQWNLYASGCADYDADDDSADWAVSPIWWVEGRYLRLRGLEERAHQSPKLKLEYVAGLLRDLAPERSWPWGLEAVAVGFDDGDFVVTWIA